MSVGMIFVDELRRYRDRPHGHGEWCHLSGDDLAELHRFAAGIGLRRAWFQDHPTLPHYDLPARMRRRAVLAGAVEVSSREFVRRLSRRRVGD